MDSTALIEEVFRNPALWKADEMAYREKSAKESAWRAVALALGWTVEDCYKRWHSLRQKYSVDLKKMKTENYKGVPFIHFDQMDFLRPYVIPRRRVKTKLSQMIADMPCCEITGITVTGTSDGSGTFNITPGIKQEPEYERQKSDDEISVRSVFSDVSTHEHEVEGEKSEDFRENELVSPGFSAISVLEDCDSRSTTSIAEPPHKKVYKGGPTQLPSYLAKSETARKSNGGNTVQNTKTVNTSSPVDETVSPPPSLLNATLISRSEPDELDLFAAQLATQMRRLKPEQRALVKVRFHEVLYNVEFGKK